MVVSKSRMYSMRLDPLYLVGGPNPRNCNNGLAAKQPPSAKSPWTFEWVERSDRECSSPARARYDEIVEPELISYHAVLAGFTVRVVVRFFEQHGRTRMTMTQEGFPDEMACKAVSQGTLESLTALEALLPAQPPPRVPDGKEKGLP